MQVSGLVRATELKVSGGKPNTAYLFRFQDTNLGRRTISGAMTDASGEAKISAPMNFGTVYVLNILEVDTGAVIACQNKVAGDGTVTMSNMPYELPASVPISKTPPDQPVA